MDSRRALLPCSERGVARPQPEEHLDEGRYHPQKACPVPVHPDLVYKTAGSVSPQTTVPNGSAALTTSSPHGQGAVVDTLRDDDTDS